MRRRGRVPVALAAGLAAVTVTACGGDDYENEPRPSVPAEVGIQITGDGLTVSPAELGAGIANFTIVNLGDIPTGVAIDGPTVGESEEVAPGTSTALKMEMETGDYEASPVDGSAAPFEFKVGAERESANNDLLLP
jgi:hypothetical protein